MNNLRLSKKLDVILKVLYLINLFCAIILWFFALLVWGNHNLSGFEFLAVTIGIVFNVFCWWLAKTAAYAIFQNAKRHVEIEELLAQHGIAFPEKEKVVPRSWLKTMIALNKGKTHVVDDVESQSVEEVESQSVENETFSVIDEAVADNACLEMGETIEERSVEAGPIEEAKEETEEDEFLRIDAEIDETIKREVVNLLSSGREMKAMLLLTNAGVPMDVAVRYIDRLKLNL